MGRTRTGCPCCSSSVSSVSVSSVSSVSVSSASSASSSAASSSVSSSIASSSVVSSSSAESVSAEPSVPSVTFESSLSALSESEASEESVSEEAYICCQSMPDTLNVLIKVAGTFEGLPCSNCDTIEFTLDPYTGTTAGTQCVGDEGVGKAWRGSFSSGCLVCDDDGEEATKCTLAGGVEVVCCNDCSIELTTLSCLRMTLWDEGFTTVITSSGDIDTCGWGAICAFTFEDEAFDHWADDCGGGTCEGIGVLNMVIYDPDDPPSDLEDHECNCADDKDFEMTSWVSPLKTRPVALDAKTGKPLSFIASESRSE